MWPLLVFLTLGLASAEDDPPIDFRGGTRLGRAGAVVSAVGLGSAAVGTASLVGGLSARSDAAAVMGVLLLPPGLVAGFTGIPLLTVGGLRAARAVDAAGGHVTQVPGIASIALGSGALTLSVIGLADGWWADERAVRFGPVAGGMLIGSAACGYVQLGASRRAGEALGLHLEADTYLRRDDLPEFWLQVSPAPVGGRPGLLLVGGF